MKIAVEGCAHGELDNIYDTLNCLEEKENVKVDILLCCGDFQTSRNEGDLRCMATPPKYNKICSFYKYYSGQKLAPLLTILIGGNHEASNYLQELPYGGWVAPRIYYLGYAGVINIAGIRIAGLSGIYKGRDYMKGHFEISPFDDNTKRSVYHVRNLEVFRLKQLSQPIDIFLSHDWPSDITDYGNKEQLIRFKPHFKDDIEANQLGSKPCQELLTALKPKYWFAAHLHCKFAALVPHDDNTVTKFLALDKCLPKRRFLQLLDIPHTEGEEMKIKYDLEWLTTLVLTNHLLSIKPVATYMPGPYGNERYCFTPTDDERALILGKLENDLTVPENFIKTTEPYDASSPKKQHLRQTGPIQNPQTFRLCNLLTIDDPIEMILKKNGDSFTETSQILTTHHLDNSISDNDNNTSVYSDEQSFINDTILDDSNPSVCSKKDSPVPRMSLSLPQPKNESQDIFFIDTDPWACKNISSKRITEEESQVDSVASKTDGKVDESENKNLSDRKKFKRRNIDLYKEEPDECVG